MRVERTHPAPRTGALPLRHCFIGVDVSRVQRLEITDELVIAIILAVVLCVVAGLFLLDSAFVLDRGFLEGCFSLDCSLRLVLQQTAIAVDARLHVLEHSAPEFG